jgi:hypothetical protein
MRNLTLVLVCVAFILPVYVSASGNDSIPPLHPPVRKNVIKFNPTPMILWSAKNLTFSYERILSPSQSASLEAGYLEFPRLFADTIVDLVEITSSSKKGINMTLEYRFYLTGLNTRSIPAGLYIGPYLTYYGYQFKNGLRVFDSTGGSGELQGKYWAFNLGVELGYQFVFWKRLTVDLVLVGPSISYYGGTTQISGSVDAGQIQEINQALYDKLMEKYPAFQMLSVDKNFQQTGKLGMVRLGFRYLLQVGFLF